MENLKTLLAQYHEKFARTEIVLELGRYLVGEAGLYVTRITDRKISRGTLYLVCDGGLHHHLAASGNLGQAIRRNYPVTIGNRIGERTENVSVVGPLCTSLDILAKDMDLPKADIGDLVVVFQSGAYGYTASPINFLSHPEPVTNPGLNCCRGRENPNHAWPAIFKTIRSRKVPTVLKTCASSSSASNPMPKVFSRSMMMLVMARESISGMAPSNGACSPIASMSSGIGTDFASTARTCSIVGMFLKTSLLRPGQCHLITRHT